MSYQYRAAPCIVAVKKFRRSTAIVCAVVHTSEPQLEWFVACGLSLQLSEVRVSSCRKDPSNMPKYRKISVKSP